MVTSKLSRSEAASTLATSSIVATPEASSSAPGERLPVKLNSRPSIISGGSSDTTKKALLPRVAAPAAKAMPRPTNARPKMMASA